MSGRSSTAPGQTGTAGSTTNSSAMTAPGQTGTAGTTNNGMSGSTSGSAGMSGSTTSGSTGMTAGARMTAGAGMTAGGSGGAMNSTNAAGVQVTSNAPIPDTAENRARYGQPESGAGKSRIGEGPTQSLSRGNRRR